MLQRILVLLGLLLLFGSTAALAATPPHPVGSDGGRQAPATGDPLVVPLGEWPAPPANPPALRPEPATTGAGAGATGAGVGTTLALTAAALVYAFSRLRFDAPVAASARPAPPPPPPHLPTPPARRRVQIDVPLVFAPPLQPRVSNRTITVQVPQTVTHLQTVLQTQRVPVVRQVQRTVHTTVTETTFTNEVLPVFDTRRTWVPEYELRRGKPFQVGGYWETEQVQTGTRVQAVPHTTTRTVTTVITEPVPGDEPRTVAVQVPVTTTELVAQQRMVSVEEPPDAVLIARVRAAEQGYRAAAERWWQALAAGDAAGLDAAARQMRTLAPQVSRDFAASLQRSLEVQHAGAVEGLVQRQRQQYWVSVARGDAAGRQKAEQFLNAVHQALGSGILDGAGSGVRAAVTSAEAVADALGRPLVRQAAVEAVHEQWRLVDAHNLAGAQAAARRLVQIGQAAPDALAAAAQAEQALGRDLRAESEAALLKAKQGWWQGLCDASDAAVAGNQVTAAGWRALCETRGVAVRQEWSAVEVQGRSQVFAAVLGACAQVLGGARGDAARRWAYYAEHRGWWLAGHEAEVLALLQAQATALQQAWWQALTDGGTPVGERAAKLRKLEAEAATLRKLTQALGLSDLPQADAEAQRARAVQYANDLAQRLAAARSERVASHIQQELDFLSAHGVVPAMNPQTGLGGAPPGEFDPAWSWQQKVDFLRPIAQELQATSCIPWQFTLAQFALESGWGRSVPHDIYSGANSRNLFGTKKGDWTGPTVRDYGTEGDSDTRILMEWRAYGSYTECFSDHDRLLTGNPNIYGAAFGVNDPYAFLVMVWAGNGDRGYATSSTYVENVSAVIYQITHGVGPTADQLQAELHRMWGANPAALQAAISRHMALRREYRDSYPAQVMIDGKILDTDTGALH